MSSTEGEPAAPVEEEVPTEEEVPGEEEEVPGEEPVLDSDTMPSEEANADDTVDNAESETYLDDSGVPAPAPPEDSVA